MSSFTFTWPKGPQEVILTGTFDNWAKTLYLVKQVDGSFSLTVPFPKSDEAVLYKYVVDGDWLVSSTQRISKDSSGNENNILEASDLIEAKSTSGSAIPEAGGLLAATGLGAAGVAAAVSHKDDVKTTVLPSTEGVQTTLGEPGIHVPKDPEALTAFEQVRDVDPKTLNEPELSAEEKKKQKKKVKRTQYKAKKKKKASGENGASTTEGETTEEQTPEPTSKDEELAIAAAATAATAAGVGAATAGVPVTSEPKPEVEAPKEIAAETKVPEVSEPVVAEVTEPVVPEVKETVPEVTKTLDPKADVAEPEVAEPVVTEPVVAEPVAAEPVTAVANGEAAVEKEVNASPVVKKPKSYESDEEIVIAQGSADKKDIAAEIAAQEGDVTVEEIQPTESEKARLTEEANIPKSEAKSAATTAAAKAASPIKAKVPATTATADKKKKEKKPNFLVRLFKKLGD